MSSSFNLNIYNYGKSELEKLLSLRIPYTNDDVSGSCAKLRDRLFQDTSKSQGDKGKINEFLEKVKVRLVKDFMPGGSVSSRPTYYSGIQNSEQLMIAPDVSALGPTSYIKKEFAPTFPIKKAPENLNPLRKRIIRRTVNIDTKFRDNYHTTESTNLHLNLPTVIKNAITMKLVGLEFPPCSIFTINKRYGNHFFHFSITDTPGGPNNLYQITIPDGNYTGFEMVQTINNEFQKMTALIAAGYELEAGIDDASCRIFFRYKNPSAGGALIFNRACASGQAGSPYVAVNAAEDPTTPLQMKLGYILGFMMGVYKIASGNPTGEWVGEAPYDGTGFKYLYLVVDDFNNNVNNYFVGAFNQSILNPNILARIPQYSRNNLNNAMLSDDVNDLATSERNYFGPINVQKLKIQLIDPFGRIVSLNNRDFSLALEFDCIYN